MYRYRIGLCTSGRPAGGGACHHADRRRDRRLLSGSRLGSFHCQFLFQRACRLLLSLCEGVCLRSGSLGFSSLHGRR